MLMILLTTVRAEDVIVVRTNDRHTDRQKYTQFNRLYQLVVVIFLFLNILLLFILLLWLLFFVIVVFVSCRICHGRQVR